MDQELIMYIVVNKELGMSPGKLSGQVAHTVTNYMDYVKRIVEGRTANEGELERFNEWYVDGKVQKKIILGGKQKDVERMEREGRFWSVRDLGLTEIDEGSLTCVCLGVMTRGEAQQYVKRLQLYR